MQRYVDVDQYWKDAKLRLEACDYQYHPLVQPSPTSSVINKKNTRHVHFPACHSDSSAGEASAVLFLFPSMSHFEMTHSHERIQFCTSTMLALRIEEQQVKVLNWIHSIVYILSIPTVATALPPPLWNSEKLDSSRHTHPADQRRGSPVTSASKETKVTCSTIPFFPSINPCWTICMWYIR